MARRRKWAMRSAALVTDYPFWLARNGASARIAALAQWLAPRTRLSVLYTGNAAPPRHWPLLPSLAHFWQTPVPRDRAHAKLIGEAIAGKFRDEPPDLAFFEFFYMQWTIPYVQARTKVCDTIDIWSRRLAAGNALGYREAVDVPEEREFAGLKKFDYVLFIQEEERDYAAAKLPPGRCLVVPHPVTIGNVTRAGPGPRAGFLASKHATNKAALAWLARDVAPHLKPRDLPALVCGGICGETDIARDGPFEFRGRVADLQDFYGAIDLALAPLPYGAGLKIKVVEAMGYGVPVLATPAAAQGLRGVPGIAVAESPEAYASALDRLLDDADERHRLGAAGRAYAAAHLTPDACFTPLGNLLA